MPVINIQIVGADYEKKRKISQVITDGISEIMEVDKDGIIIIFNDVDEKNLSMGG